jgi:hypothetical protein
LKQLYAFVSVRLRDVNWRGAFQLLMVIQASRTMSPVSSKLIHSAWLILFISVITYQLSALVRAVITLFQSSKMGAAQTKQQTFKRVRLTSKVWLEEFHGFFRRRESLAVGGNNESLSQGLRSYEGLLRLGRVKSAQAKDSSNLLAKETVK